MSPHQFCQARVDQMQQQGQSTLPCIISIIIIMMPLLALLAAQLPCRWPEQITMLDMQPAKYREACHQFPACLRLCLPACHAKPCHVVPCSLGMACLTACLVTFLLALHPCAPAICPPPAQHQRQLTTKVATLPSHQSEDSSARGDCRRDGQHCGCRQAGRNKVVAAVPGLGGGSACPWRILNLLCGLCGTP